MAGSCYLRMAMLVMCFNPGTGRSADLHLVVILHCRKVAPCIISCILCQASMYLKLPSVKVETSAVPDCSRTLL